MPLSDTISKGKLSAYQRWEMTSFEENRNTKASSDSVAAANKLELDKLKLKAQKEGFTKGFEEGHQVGVNTGLKELQQELQTFTQLSSKFTGSLQQAEQIIAQDVLDLALDLAKAMLKNALQIHPELIVPIVEQAVSSLPSVHPPAQIFLHPDDANVVKYRIGEELTKTGWTVMTDPHLNKGDCRIETGHNQINATLANRWQQLTDALGRVNHWIESDHIRK